jgi:hypothetical protein
LLPPKSDGFRWANADPITGQAAWYDLFVKIEKAPSTIEISEPIIKPQISPVGMAPKNITYGDKFK